MHRLKSGVCSHPDAHSEIESEIGDRKQFAEAVSSFTDLSADERERERKGVQRRGPRWLDWRFSESEALCLPHMQPITFPTVNLCEAVRRLLHTSNFAQSAVFPPFKWHSDGRRSSLRNAPRSGLQTFEGEEGKKEGNRDEIATASLPDR